MMIRQSLQNIWAAFTASLLRLKALSKKELITLLLDPSVRRILFVPILAQSILFGYGATFNLEEAPYVLYDASHTPDSRALSARLEAVSLSAQRKCPQLRPLRQPLPTAAHLSASGSQKTLRKNSRAAKPLPFMSLLTHATRQPPMLQSATLRQSSKNLTHPAKSDRFWSLKTATATTKTASLAGTS